MLVSSFNPKDKSLSNEQMRQLRIGQDDEGHASDDDGDSEYEHRGGELCLYASRVQSVDEIRTVKETLIHLSSKHPEQYTQYMSKITDLAEQKKI